MHLRPDELIDLAEGTRAESSATHLAECAVCRLHLAELKAMMSAAADLDVPEPSPLFWDHFSARVHDAIAADGAPPRSLWDRLALPLSIAACAAVIVAAAVSLRVGWTPGFVPSGPAPVASHTSPADELPAADLAPFPDDPSLDLVADLASQVAQADWDAAGAQGLETHEDTADKAVGQLSAGERRELQRLLKEELTRRGA
jgi:hypothetical protein